MSYMQETPPTRWCNNFAEMSKKFQAYIENLAFKKDNVFPNDLFFYHNRKFCFECLRIYYSFKSTICKKSELRAINIIDAQRISKMFANKKKKYAMFETVVYNWSMLKNTFLRTECVKTLKTYIGKNIRPFNRLAFSHIVLLLFHEHSLSEYVAMTMGAHLINGTLFLHTSNIEWEYLIEFSSFYSNKVFKENIYCDFKILGWIYAVFVYISIEGTYFDNRIIDIINKLFFELDHPQCKVGIFMIVLALVKREKFMLYKFEKIYEGALDYKLLRFLVTLQPSSVKYTENMIFWHPMYCYVNAFPSYCKLRLESRYFEFFSEMVDDFYKRELYVSILTNIHCITSVREFMYGFPFFEELIIECLKCTPGDTNYLFKLNPDFVFLCSQKTCNLFFKVGRYQGPEWEVLYTILYKWFKALTFIIHEISDKKDTIDIKQLFSFVLIVYYDIENYLSQNCPINKITDLYINFRKKLLSTLLRSKKSLLGGVDNENIIYITIIRYHVKHSKVSAKFYDLLREDILIRIMDKHCVFYKKFGYNTPYFISFLDVLKNIPKINFSVYERFFTLLLNKFMAFAICELISSSIEKIEICQKDLQDNYISSLNWYDILGELNDDDFFEVKKKIISGSMKFLDQNKCKLSDEQKQKYINIAAIYGLCDFHEYFHAEAKNLHDDLD